MSLRMIAMAAALVGAVSMFGGSAASAMPANGPAIGAAAANHEVQPVQYWHHRHWRHHWGYRHYYWGHRHWRHRYWW